MAETPIGEVLLIDVRLSFEHLYQPGKPMKNDKGEEVRKYNANFLIDPSTKSGAANMAKLKKAGEEVKKAKWGNKIPKLKADRVCVRDGNEEDWEGYAGMYYVSGSNKDKPSLMLRQKDSKGNWKEAKPGDIYSGCYVNAIVRLWAQDSEDYGKRMNCSIESVQFNREGKAFSGAPPVDPNEAFKEIEEDEGSALGEDADEDDDVAGLI